MPSRCITPLGIRDAIQAQHVQSRPQAGTHLRTLQPGTMKKHVLTTLLALSGTASFAQNWIVGEPVDMQVSSVTVYGGGCGPGPQATLALNVPPVSGITYYYRVIGITTDGEYTMYPGPAAPLQVNDTIHVGPFGNLVYNSGSFGGLELEAWVEGAPTMPGEAHPCAPNNLWMSNLLLCNEGLSCTVPGACVTEVSSGLAMPGGAGLSFDPPCTANGFSLSCYGPVRTGRVTDLQGRAVAEFSGGRTIVDASAWPSGAYVVHLSGNDGTALRRTFVLAR